MPTITITLIPAFPGNCGYIEQPFKNTTLATVLETIWKDPHFGEAYLNRIVRIEVSEE